MFFFFYFLLSDHRFILPAWMDKKGCIAELLQLEIIFSRKMFSYFISIENCP